MCSQIKKIIKQKKEDILQDQKSMYLEFQVLVEQTLHASIIAKEMLAYRWKLVASTGLPVSPIVLFSQVALGDFAIQQLWKFFDEKNSIFHIWHIAELTQNPNVLKWLQENVPEIQGDIELICEWRHNAIGHRGEAAYFATSEFEKKFAYARTNEKRLQDFLFEYLCVIKFETQGAPPEDTMQGLSWGLDGFERRIRSDMSKVFSNTNMD